jgi:hypothetical protein
MSFKIKNTLVIFILLLFLINGSKAQISGHNINFQLLSLSANGDFILKIDTLKKNTKDSSSITKKPVKHNPKIATLLSTLVPGAGQIYNKKYWKTPIVWAGIGTCVYFVRSNHILYKDYKDAILQRSDTSIKEPDKYLDIYSTDQLVTLQDQYRQNRDLLIIAASLVYILNIVDALVDAHLYSFDVSDDLSLNWQPYFRYSVNTKNTVGLSFNLKF